MTVIREQILAEVAARLGAIAGVGEVERMPSGDPIEFPALHVFDGGQTAEDGDVLASRYTMELEIVGFADGTGGASAHAALNTLYAQTVAALVTDPPLGGLAETIDEGDVRVTVAPLADTSRLAFSLDLTVTFTNRRGNPALPA